ncbi:hypothetical protein C7974DRAFT_191473 [Boeremia exigua]|uniref:uncharacterized protein n=1 Tax=Boeremia exigua TaxID=749465 RepID=UPI001E8CF0D7|nr:uncharacterized protein C7974DRAFT_191473 [Boeremia exigua]KAH6629717.1 hypothetical protein C7974DRAFT_191473 [Boeremia exigua]
MSSALSFQIAAALLQWANAACSTSTPTPAPTPDAEIEMEMRVEIEAETRPRRPAPRRSTSSSASIPTSRHALPTRSRAGSPECSPLLGGKRQAQQNWGDAQGACWCEGAALPRVVFPMLGSA